MRKMRMSLLSLMAGALVLGSVIVSDVSAGIRVEATVRTPNARVRIGNLHSRPYRGHATEYFPDRMHYEVVRRDRKIARRLSRYAGVSSYELIQLKRRGYSWFQIGRQLQLPRPVVRAAMTNRSWNRFLRDDRHAARRYDDPHRMKRVAHFDGRYRH